MVNGSTHLPEVFILKRSANVLYDNKRFADAALQISNSTETDLRNRLSTMPLDAYIDSIPQSLLLLDTLYSKFFLFVTQLATDRAQIDQFPINILKPDRLVRQLIWFLTRELDPGGNAKRRGADWKLVGPRLRNLLRVVNSICPLIRRQLRVEKDEIEKALEGLGLHGLINFGDHQLIEIGEAVKHELSDHYHRVKALYYQVEKLLHKMVQIGECGNVGNASGAHGGGGLAGGKDTSITYSINDLKGPVPSQSSHQRLMNLRLSEIKMRLQRNECMIQLVQACLRNPDLQSLERILQKRIRYDRDILTQFAYLTRRNATYALASEDPIVSHVLVLFSKGYDRLLKLMPRSPGTNPSVTDDSGLGDDDEEKARKKATNGHANGAGASRAMEINGHANGDRNHAIHSDDSTTAAVTSIYSDPKELWRQSGLGQNGATPQFLPSDHSDRQNGHKHRPNRNNFRRTATATTPINYDPRPQNRSINHLDQGYIPRVSAFRSPSPPQSQNGQIGQERVYSSLPCLNNNLATVCAHQYPCAQYGQCQGHVNGNGHQNQRSTPAVSSQEKVELLRLRSEVDQLHTALEAAHDRIKKQQYQLNSQRFLNTPNKNLIGQPRQNSQNQVQMIDLIERFGTLYSIDRLETMIELDRLTELHDAEELQTKILLSVIVLSFRFAWQEIHKCKEEVWRSLGENRSFQDLERDSNSPAATFLHHLAEYMLEKARSDNYAKTAWKVSDQLFQTLYDFSSLKSCGRLNQFIVDSSKLAWHLSASNPSYTIEFEEAEFDLDRHMRFHTSNLQAKQVRRFIWPALIQSSNRKCVYRAVVIT